MGAWNTSITGNDTAQDLISEYQAAFYYYDVNTALEKIDYYVRTEGLSEDDQEEWCNYYYSLADFMHKKGILTETVKEKILQMIDSGFGLELWAESGTKILNKRKKALEDFRNKICSPQPSKKKIRMDLHLTPVFDIGDLIAIQLKTEDKTYLTEDSFFDEQFFRECNNKWVVLRKVEDYISYSSSIVPDVKDIWPFFQLYRKIFDDCPQAEQIKNVKWAKCFHRSQLGVYGCEGSMFYFKKRNYKIIGKSLDNIESATNVFDINDSFYFGINMPHYNADTIIINAVVKE